MNKSLFKYTKCYCEENIYLLLKKLAVSHPITDFSVLFLSNKRKTFPIWYQKASKEPEGFTVWDYHVVLFDQKQKLVYDFDTSLSFPETGTNYFSKALKFPTGFREDFIQEIREVSGQFYLTDFASDRSHMLKNEEYLSPVPDYDCIQTKTTTNNLPEYFDFSSKAKGSIFTRDEFWYKFIQ